jgi:hypothetical protein
LFVTQLLQYLEFLAFSGLGLKYILKKYNIHS